MMKKVAVTESDIRKGKRCDPCGCPVALALKRSGFPHASVLGTNWMTDWRIEPPDDGHLLPPEAARFVDDFDEGRDVEPIAFEVEAGA